MVASRWIAGGCGEDVSTECRFSSIQIGQRISYRTHDATCWQCGNMLPPEILDCEYRGHQDFEGASCDLLVSFMPLICSECGNACTFLLAMCGKGWGFEVSEAVQLPAVILDKE